MIIAKPVTCETLPEFCGSLDLLRRNDGKLLRKLTYFDAFSEMTRGAELEMVLSGSGQLKHLRIAEAEPERPKLQAPKPFPRVDPLTFATARTPEHEQTTDSGFNLLPYPQPSRMSGKPWSYRYGALARPGAGLSSLPLASAATA